MSLPINAGTWSLDKVHSTVEFVVKHLGLSNVRGRFGTFDATLVVGGDLASTKVTATVPLSSVDTNNADRDNHLKSTDFFGVDANPTMTFASNAITGSGDDYTMKGDLTINGVTKPVSFEVEFNGTETNPMSQKTHAGFSAKAEIKRSDFGIDFNAPLGADKFLISDKVKVELELQFVAG